MVFRDRSKSRSLKFRVILTCEMWKALLTKLATGERFGLFLDLKPLLDPNLIKQTVAVRLLLRFLVAV